MSIRFIAVLALAVAMLACSSEAAVTTTDFCASAYECCAITSICLKYLDVSEAEAGSGTGVFTSCPHPTCPLGWTLTGSVCNRDDTSVAPTSSINAFTTLASCLAVQASRPQSYHTRHCIEGLMQTKRACLFNIGLKG